MFNVTDYRRLEVGFDNSKSNWFKSPVTNEGESMGLLQRKKRKT